MSVFENISKILKKLFYNSLIFYLFLFRFFCDYSLPGIFPFIHNISIFYLSHLPLFQQIFAQLDHCLIFCAVIKLHRSRCHCIRNQTILF